MSVHTYREPNLQRYCMTAADFEELLERQGGGCAICGDTEARLDVDHDHTCCSARVGSCGKCIRGLLCNPCNRMLADARDSVERLQSAIQYLNNAVPSNYEWTSRRKVKLPTAAVLREHSNNGLSLAEIAAIYGATKQGVRQKMNWVPTGRSRVAV